MSRAQNPSSTKSSEKEIEVVVPQPDHGGLLHAGFLLARGAFWAPGLPPGCSGGGVSQICQGSGSAPRLRPFRTTPTVLGKHGSSTVELVLDSPQQSEDLPPIDWSFAFLLPSPSEFYLECILVYHVRLLQRPSAKSCLIGEAHGLNGQIQIGKQQGANVCSLRRNPQMPLLSPGSSLGRVVGSELTAH